MFNPNILRIANLIFMVLILLAALIFSYRLQYIALGFKKFKPFPKTNVQKKFCVLIAARNESNVIGRLLKSLKEQNYDPDKFDVYVIVEDKNDKTVEITQSFGYIPFVRKDLTKVGKGYALDECIQEIFHSKKDYDILTIVDADNILAPNYLEEFNNAFCYGYEVGNACRRQLNEPGNWLADCSTLTFAGINTFQNKGRTIYGRNIIMSGSGLYIDFNIIKQLKGWIFTTLTEDYELSAYCTLHNIKTAYIPTTYYYDEQPTTFSQSRKQRVRWIKGYFQTRKIYSKLIKQDMLKSKTNITSKLDITVGVLPNILFIVSIILYELFNLVTMIYLAVVGNPLYLVSFKNFMSVLLVTYLVLQMYTLLQLKAEKENFDYDFKTSLKIIIMNPIYVCLYIPFAIEALLSKNVGWAPIKHGQAKTSSRASSPIVEIDTAEEEPVLEEEHEAEEVTTSDKFN